jgi:hypothetical protein
MIRKVKCASYCWPDTLSTLGDERWVMNVAAPFLCPYSIKPSRDAGERGVLAVTAFKIAGREMHLHQESAAPGRSRATRRQLSWRSRFGTLGRLSPTIRTEAHLLRTRASQALTGPAARPWHQSAGGRSLHRWRVPGPATFGSASPDHRASAVVFPGEE